MAERKEENIQDEAIQKTIEQSKEEEGRLKVEVIERAGKKWTRASLVQLGIMIFVTFVACTLFFFAVLRFDGFAEVWNKIFRAAQPITFGLVLAFLLNPVMKYLEEPLLKFFVPRMKDEKKAKKAARSLAVTGAIIFLLVVIGLFIAAVAPSLVNSIRSLVAQMPEYVKNFVKMIQTGRFGDTEIADWVTRAITELTDYLEQWAQNSLIPMAQTYLSQITSGVFSVLKGMLNFIIGIIVAVYVMMIQDTLLGQSKKIVYAIFKPAFGNTLIHTIRKCADIFSGFISGKLIDSLIIGIICYLGCLILRIPNALLVAVIIGVTNIIPFFGPIIGAVPAVLLVIIQSPIHALYLAIFIIVLQQVDGNIIGPKILGDSTGLSSFWIMFAILVFGGIWGFLGMLLGVPIMAVIYYIVTKLVRYALRKKGLPDNTEEYIKARGVNLDTKTLRYSTPEQKDTEKKQKAGLATKFKQLFRRKRNKK